MSYKSYSMLLIQHPSSWFAIMAHYKNIIHILFCLSVKTCSSYPVELLRNDVTSVHSINEGTRKFSSHILAISYFVSSLADTHFHSEESLQALQKFDKVKNITSYAYEVTGSAGKSSQVIEALNTKGSGDIGRKVLVFKDGADSNSTILSESNDDSEGFTVLKLIEPSSGAEEAYWIFKAFVRKFIPEEMSATVYSVDGRNFTVSWGPWEEQFPAIEAPLVNKPQGRTIGKGKVAKTASDEKEEDLASPESTNDNKRPVNKNKGTKLDTKGKPVEKAHVEADFTEDDDENSDEETVDEERQFDEHRYLLQKEAFKALIKSGLKEPSYTDIIKSDKVIYSHVRWYSKYLNDTEVYFNKTANTTNFFDGYLYGKCPKQNVPFNRLREAVVTIDIVDYYAAMMKEQCHPDVVKMFNKLFQEGYLHLNQDRSIEIVKDNSLLKKKDLTIAETGELLRLLSLSAYSIVYVSLVTHPTEPLDPTGRPLHSRGFILINTVLHMLDFVIKYAPHHYKTVVMYLFHKLQSMGQEVFCKYVGTYSSKGSDFTLKKVRKNSAIALSILLEYLSLCSRNSKPNKKEDAHAGFKATYNDAKLNLFEKYKVKVLGLRKNQKFINECATRFRS